MRSARPLLVTALVFLFFAEGQRAFFASLFALLLRALEPSVQPALVALALTPLLALLLPLLPLAHWLDRPGAAAMAAAAVAVFRVPMTLPDLAIRAAASGLVVATAIMFVGWSVGQLERRPLAAGAVLGLVADQLLRLAGDSWDLSLRAGWLPVQALLSLILLGLVLLSMAEDRRVRDRPRERDELERRSGGLRLRGSLALGGLLFLDLHLIGVAAVAARWTGAAYGTVALALAVGGAVAVAVVLSAVGGADRRKSALILVLVIAVGVVAGWMAAGLAPALLIAAGHGAALLLVARTLEPASGRRGRGVASAGLVVLVAWTTLYSVAVVEPSLVPLGEAAALWVAVAAVLFVGVCFILLPHRPASDRSVGVPVGAAAGLAIIAIAAVLARRGAPPDETLRASADGASRARAPAGAPLIEANYGFDADGRFDPGVLVAAARRAGPGVVVLARVPAGLPIAYGADLPRLLEKRLGSPVRFEPESARLLGRAVIRRAPGQPGDSRPGRGGSEPGANPATLQPPRAETR